MTARVTHEATQAAVRAIQHMTDSDAEYFKRVADVAGIGSADVDAPDRYVGEGHKLPRCAHTFTGAHGTMSPIDVADDDAEFPSAQPDPIDVAEDSLSGYIEAEPGRQDAAGHSDDGGSGAVPLAADSVDASGLGVDAHVWNQ